jgi:hypothetical protein
MDLHKPRRGDRNSHTHSHTHTHTHTHSVTMFLSVMKKNLGELQNHTRERDTVRTEKAPLSHDLKGK